MSEMLRRWGAPVGVTAGVVALLLCVWVIGRLTHDDGVRRLYGPEAENTGPVKVDSKLGVTFDSEPQRASEAPLTPDQAYKRFSGRGIPAGTTVEYGFLTLPLTPPAETGSKTEFAYKGRPVWAYVYKECPVFTGVMPDEDPAISEARAAVTCTMWRFLAPGTGEHIVEFNQQ